LIAEIVDLVRVWSVHISYQAKEYEMMTFLKLNPMLGGLRGDEDERRLRRTKTGAAVTEMGE